jgi:mono/diheme cytochrome c family protein
MKRIALLSFSLAVLSSACGPAIDPDGTWTTKVHPLFTSRCSPCHNGDPGVSERGPGEFAADDAGKAYTAALEKIEPGDSASSLIVTRLTSAPFMPPAGDPLSDEEVAIVSAWIDDGAKP